jgi:hypothetical protein
MDYSSNLIKALSLITEDWVIFWVEDRPPASPVDTDRLVKLIQLAQAKDAGYLKLIPCNPPAFVNKVEEIGEIPKGSRYRISMTVALWKKETLLKILKAGETAWDIEKKGGIERANAISDRFFALPIETFAKPPLLDIHLISKGKIMWRGLKMLKEERLLNYFENRPKASFWKNVYFESYDLIWKFYFRTVWFYKKLRLSK